MTSRAASGDWGIIQMSCFFDTEMGAKFERLVEGRVVRPWQPKETNWVVLFRSSCIDGLHEYPNVRAQALKIREFFQIIG